MSWSASGNATVRKVQSENEDPTFSLESFAMTSQGLQKDYGEAESQRAFEAAQEAAQKLLESGAFGEGTFLIRLTGHSNTGNARTRGYANDEVTVSIGQADLHTQI
jgi:hypothetical protein